MKLSTDAGGSDKLVWPMAHSHGQPNLHPLLSAEPEALKALFRGVEIYGGLSGADLREMGKFTEIPNVWGLPVHAIDKPPRGEAVREFGGPLADLPGGMIRHLRAALHEQPLVAVRGSLAGGCKRPFRALGLVPQSHAHLAQGLQAALWPDRSPESAPADLVLVYWPDFDRQLMLSVPASKLALILGTDDLRGGFLVALELANRVWMPPPPIAEQGQEAEPALPEIQILPGGCFPADTQGRSPENSGPQTLIFTGESIPVGWDEEVPKQIPALEGRPAVEIALGGAEPWIAQSGGMVCPLWYNPPLPAILLRESPAWTEAALHPAALPFGIEVRASGEVDLRESDELAFVVVPRRAIPFPFANSAAPVKVRRLLRHSRAREQAMLLWANGFPSPEAIEGL